jgi:hypothetical protein
VAYATHHLNNPATLKLWPVTLSLFAVARGSAVSATSAQGGPSHPETTRRFTMRLASTCVRQRTDDAVRWNYKASSCAHCATTAARRLPEIRQGLPHDPTRTRAKAQRLGSAEHRFHLGRRTAAGPGGGRARHGGAYASTRRVAHAGQHPREPPAGADRQAALIGQTLQRTDIKIAGRRMGALDRSARERADTGLMRKRGPAHRPDLPAR